MIDEVTIWDCNSYSIFSKSLFKYQDIKFRDFNKRIVNTSYNMIGIRTPILRSIAKDISKTDIISYLECDVSDCYEEILIYGFVLSYLDDLDSFIKYFDKFILLIDNWALCDLALCNLNIVINNKDYFFNKINEYLSSDEFVCRVGVVLLLYYYIDEFYLNNIFDIITCLKRDEYYVNMAVAWLLSVCFVKFRDRTLKYLEECNLDKFVFNMTISKICDSFRVSDLDKAYLKKLKNNKD